MELYGSTLSLKTHLHSSGSSGICSLVAERRAWKTPDTAKDDQILLQVF